MRASHPSEFEFEFLTQVTLNKKDEFISVIGHELRTPLNAIIQLSSAIMANFGVPGAMEKQFLWMETISHRYGYVWIRVDTCGYVWICVVLYI
jgi:signal transduction histidine kinase